MMSEFYSLLTTIGAAKIASAIANTTTLDITHIALGDGNGSAVNPTVNTSSLVNEVYRHAINSILVNPQNPNWINVDLTIPAGVGGWTIREFILVDVDGDAIFVGNMDAQPKPLLPSGTSVDLFLRFIIEVNETSAITMIIDPNLVTATQQWVISYVSGEFVSFNLDHESLNGLLGGAEDEHYHLTNPELDRVQSPFFLSKQIVTQNHTLPDGFNAGGIDTIIADGITVTVPVGATLMVL